MPSKRTKNTSNQTTDQATTMPICNYHNKSIQYDKSATAQSKSAMYLCKMAETAIKAQCNILDIGCGTSFISSALKHLDIKHHKLTGIDKSDQMISISRNKFPENQFIISDAFNIPNLIKGTDVILSNFAIHWFKEPIKWLQFCTDNMKKEAHLFAAIPTSGSLNEIHRSAQKANLPKMEVLTNLTNTSIRNTALTNCKLTIIETKKLSQTFKTPLEAIRSLTLSGAYKANKTYTVNQMKALLNKYKELYQNKNNKCPLSYKVTFLYIYKTK